MSLPTRHWRQKPQLDCGWRMTGSPLARSGTPAPPAGLDAVEVVQLRLETPSRLVEAVVRTPCEPDLVEERLE
jgi:hypothetical protein